MALNRHSLNKTLLTLFIFSLALDSFPIPFVNSVYKPLSIFPIIFITLLNLNWTSPKIKVRPVLLVFLYSILIISIILSFSIDEFKGFKKFFFEIIIIIIVAHSNWVILNYFELTELKRIIGKVSHITFKALLGIGFLQLLSRFSSVILTITTKINTLLIYRHDESRIQFLSGEPSMGVRTLIFFLILSRICGIKLPKLQLGMAITLVLLSGSTFGLIFTILFISIYIFLNSKNKITLFIRSFKIFGYFLVGAFLLKKSTFLLPEYAQSKLEVVETILLNFSTDTFIAIAQYDGSFFLRVFNPIIGLIIFLDHWILGIGGENFTFYYSQYITDYFPFAKTFPTVAENLYYRSEITPKSLVVKLITEFGIIGIVGILTTTRFLLNVSDRHNLLIPIIAFIFALSINYDSYIYFPLIFSFSLIHRLSQTEYSL